MGRGVERAARLIEADVAISADAQDLQVAVAGSRHGGLIGVAGGLEVVAQGIGAVQRAGPHVHTGTQVPLHEGGVALGVPLGQTDVLVEHEASDLLEGDAPGLATASELVVEGKRTRPRGGSQNSGGFRGQKILNGIGGALGDGLGGVQDHELHRCIPLRRCGDDLGPSGPSTPSCATMRAGQKTLKQQITVCHPSAPDSPSIKTR